MTRPLDLLGPHRPAVASSLVLAVLGALLELVPHGIVYLIAQRVFAGSSQVGLQTLAAVALCAVVVRYLLVGGSLLLSHAVAFKVLRAVRSRMVQRLAAAPTTWFDGTSPGQLKKALVEDVDALENAVAHQLPDLASAICVPLVGFVALASIDWRMALASVALVPIAFGVMAFAMRDMGEQMAAWHAAEQQANESILEFLRGIVVLKAHDRDASSMGRVRNSIFAIRDLAGAMTRRTSVGYTAFFTLLSSNLVVVLPVGVWLHRSGGLSQADLVLFMLLGFGLTSSLLKLLFLFGDAQMNAVRWERVRSVLDAPSRPVTGGAEPTSAKLVLEGVSYRYADDRPLALDDVSFVVEPGTVTALVGPSGAGKSTVARLVAASRSPTVGRIELGGVGLDALSVSQRAAQIAVIAQVAYLFHGTLRDNLAMARPDASDAELEAAARAASLMPLIERLPAGWDTEVGERGATLSGGEAQRVAIARALLRRTPVVVLDEITSNLDAENERRVQQALSVLLEGRTVLVIAHRLRTVATADQIVVLDAGRVVDRGTHPVLLKRCATYRRLWEAQEAAGSWRIHSSHDAPEVTA